MKKTEDCFLKVKNDYLKFLNKEKIFSKSIAAEITNLKKTYIPISFWIENTSENILNPQPQIHPY